MFDTKVPSTTYRSRRAYEVQSSDTNLDNQFVLEGRVKNSKRGTGAELITFHLDLGIIILTFIVTIPSEDTDAGPVYVKYAMNPRLIKRWFKPGYTPEENQENG